MIDYNCELASSDGLVRLYRVSASPEFVGGRLDAELKKIRLKGFRPNKSPPIDFLRNRFGAGVRVEVVKQLVHDINDDAVKKKVKDKVASIRIVDFNDCYAGESADPAKSINPLSAGISYGMEVELFPEFKEVNFAEITVASYEVEPTPDEITKEIEGMKDYYSETSDKPEGSVIEAGDTAEINFVGTLDGKPFQGGSGRGVRIDQGAGRFLKDFEEGILGMTKGEKKEVEVSFPDDYGSENLAGKTAVFVIEAVNIAAKRKMETNEELAGKLNVKDVDEVSVKASDNIKNRSASLIHEIETKNLFDALEPSINHDVPPTFFDKEARSLYESAADNGGVTFDQFKEDNKDLLQRRVCVGMYLLRFAEENNIKVEDHDITMAVMGNIGLMQLFRKDRKEAMNAAYPYALERKSVDRMLGMVKKEVTAVSYADLVDLYNRLNSKDDSEAVDNAADQKKQLPKSSAKATSKTQANTETKDTKSTTDSDRAGKDKTAAKKTATAGTKTAAKKTATAGTKTAAKKTAK